MARKKGPPIAEAARKSFGKSIDNRYKDGMQGVKAKEERRLGGKKK
jgi:hypothetical protein